MKIPICYPGGKSKSASYINKFILQHSEFREPFFGGGSMSFFRLLNYGHSGIFPIKYKGSDLYKNLFCFWKLLREDLDYLLMRVEQDKLIDMNIKQRISNEGYEELKKLFKIRQVEHNTIFRDFDVNTDFREAGYNFFFLNVFSFSGMVGRSGITGRGKTCFSESKLVTVTSFANLMKHIDIKLQDYSILIDEPGEDVFLFVDPPYSGNRDTKLYGMKGDLHKTFDHQRLFEHLSNCKHKWLMTYDINDEILKLYKDFYVREFDIYYSIHVNKNKINKEIMIANYDINKM